MSQKHAFESDSKYGSYSAAIEKCLKSFEYSNEWADLIPSLVRLIKLVQQYSRYNVIPKKRLMGKRLAQCLHPALPSGVHCKTLECFDLIFRIMGPDHLAADIDIYSPCLFGLLGPSAMTVKPLLLNIFETYFIPLGNKLRSSFLGLLQGLLPGLEEGSEFFERVNNIIEAFCRIVGPEFFYTCIWQVFIQAPSVRHFGTAFILNHFNKRRDLSSQAYYFGTSIAVLLKSLRCLLSDPTVLVERDTLDFVILCLPVHLVASTESFKQPSQDRSHHYHPLYGKITASEMRDLIAVALTVLLRRDASLNRRLFAWLLGSQTIEPTDISQHSTTVARMALPTNSVQSDSDSTIQQKYFKTFSLQPLKEALQSILRSTLTSASTGGAKNDNYNACFGPFRLMGGLLNHSEIGSCLIELVLVDLILFTLHMYRQLQCSFSVNAMGSKCPFFVPPSESSFSQTQRNTRRRNLPQQTLDMLAQHDFCRLRSRGSNDIVSETSTTCRSSIVDEFMREAELFFSNLEPEFLWPFLQSHFFASSTKLRPGWVSAVRFLVEHLPIDTYPGVQGCHLPQMVSDLTASLCERMPDLGLAEIAGFIDLLGVLIAHIQEHMVKMMDQSLAEVSHASTTGASHHLERSSQRHKELLLIASAVGGMRRFLAAFFENFLCPPSSDTVENCLIFLRSGKKTFDELSNDFYCFLNPTLNESDRCAVVDLLAQLCRLVVDMCNVPLLQSSLKALSIEEAELNRLFVSGDSVDDVDVLLPDAPHFEALPKWLTCLVVGGALSTDFDTKAICLHTLLDLVEASTSIHGWFSNASSSSADLHRQQQPIGQSGLLLPVLTPKVLNTLAFGLDFFSVTGVSLWFFLDDPTYAEDVASLLVRLLTVAPGGGQSICPTETLVEDFIVERLLSSDPALRLLAHRRFTLLWKFLRCSSNPNVPVPEAAAVGTATLPTFRSSVGTIRNATRFYGGWRRAAMGLPSVASETASSVANFDRCLLVLLDSLDDTETRGSRSIDSNGKSMTFCDPLILRPPITTNASPQSSDSKLAGGTTEEGKAWVDMRQEATTWLISALCSGQARRIVAPLFSTLLHPSTVRVSLSSLRRRRHLLRRHQRRRNRRLKRSGALLNNTQAKPDGTASTQIEDESEEDANDAYADFENDTNSADDNEYDRDIWAVSGGSPSDQLHFYFAPTASQPSTSKSTRKGEKGEPKKVDGKPWAVIDADVFGEEYCPVDVMAPLQSNNLDVETGVSDVERLSINRARQDVIQTKTRCDALLSEILTSQFDSNKRTTAKAIHTSLDRLVASPVRVLPVHEHILVYLHKFDVNQVIYAFSRLRAILKANSGTTFVLALAATPTASNLTTSSTETPHHSTACTFRKLFGTDLVDLLARHYRCLLAGDCDNFVRQSTMDEVKCISTSRMPSLLDVLLFICLTFLLSLVLPSESSSMSTTNANVHLMASEVIRLITEKLLRLSVMVTPTDYGKLASASDEDKTKMAEMIAILHNPGSSWINAVIQRSGLPQAVVHCLAASTELAHISDSLSAADDTGLPLCLRLLKFNARSEGSSELWNLLQVTHHLLQLTTPCYEFSLKSAITTSAAISTPPSGRASKNPSTANNIASVMTTAQSTSPAPRAHIFPGTLPWCTAYIPVLESTLKALAFLDPSPALLAVLTTHFVGSSSSSTNDSHSRHLATQTLLLNTVRLALSPKIRTDQQLLWFGFLRMSLVHWGAATALLINLMITQMAASLQILTEPFCNTATIRGMNGQTNNNAQTATGKHHQLRASTIDYPPDYTLQLLSCLQGIVCTFLLPFGQSKSSLSSGMTFKAAAFARDGSSSASRSSPARRDESSSIPLSTLKGTWSYASPYETPEVIRESLRVAEVLQTFYARHPQKLDFAPLGPALKRMQQAFQDSESQASGLPYTLLFASKDLLGTEVMPNSTDSALNWTRGCAELCHVFPVLLSSLAAVWLALNNFSDPSSLWSLASLSESLGASSDTAASDGSPDLTISPNLRCGFNRLAALIALGHPGMVRQSINTLLEPLVRTHPGLIFTAVAQVWPPLVTASNSSSGGGGGGGGDLLWLLSSSASGLPLTPHQCALVSLISGGRWGFQELVDGSRCYVGLPSVSNNSKHPMSLLKASRAVETLRSLLRSPPSSLAHAFTLDLIHNETNASSYVEVTLSSQTVQSSLLHFLYAWIVTTGGIGSTFFQLGNIQDFLRDVVPLTSITAAISTSSNVGTAITSPISVFLLVKIFNKIIVTLSNKDEKRDQKDLQDICQGLMEATASMAGTALEQATWFRRGLQVRTAATVSADVLGTPRSISLVHPVSEGNLAEMRTNDNTRAGAMYESQELVSSDYRESTSTKVCLNEDLSVLALRMLAEHMAVFFDVVYKSEEKDRVPSALNNGILTNILPFLRSHNNANAGHFTAASQVMAAVSSYQFTRRAWRREVFELFLDPAFFQATATALYSWCSVIDNLMTQEKNTFREALTRLVVSQGTGLNLFSSKDAEYEQRAAHLKKISFIVFASEYDQYSRSVSEILERLTDNLRAVTDTNVPILTQLFLCTRVLIARISADSLASLWFIVIPELVNVFRIFAERVGNGSRKHSPLNYDNLQRLPQSQLNLLLSACKLLATFLLLPESSVPQLLFHRWVFVNSPTDGRSAMEAAAAVEEEAGKSTDSFQPLISRISSALTSIYSKKKKMFTTPLLQMTNACYFILSVKTVTAFDHIELFLRSLGEKRAALETSSEVLNEGIFSQILEVSIFNEFPEPMTATK